MRISIVVAIMLAQISFASASLADDAKMAVTPSKIALDFVSTVFFDRKADRVVDFCCKICGWEMGVMDGRTDFTFS